MVFDGLNAPYREEYPVCPVNIYGEQKILAEEGMLKFHPSVVICRMALMFGISGSNTINFFQQMIKAMKEEHEFRLFVDEFRTPGLFLALKKVNGLLRLGGIESISRYDFAKLLVNTLGVREAVLVPCR